MVGRASCSIVREEEEERSYPVRNGVLSAIFVNNWLPYYAIRYALALALNEVILAA